MAESPTQTQTLIAGRFAVDPSRQLPDAGGGLPAYAAVDRQAADSQRVALLVSRDTPPRIDPLDLLGDPIDNLMTPIGHGVAPAPGGKGEAYYIITSAPPGPPLSASLRPWTERALIDQVLRPAAQVLDQLSALRLTHRAIRLNNVFQGAPGQPVTLGAAWSALPAMHQPAIYEAPANAVCHPCGRGDGTIADDVYSLGVLMLILAAGRVPFEGKEDSFVIRAVLENGSFAALARDLKMSAFLADLLRGMMAEDPDHRPAPALLLEPGAARARRIAMRPGRRSQEPLIIGDIAAGTSRALAYALLRDERKAIQALRGDAVTTWLRRALGDAGMASRIEERVRARLHETRTTPQSDAIFLMQCIAMLNPQMPLVWRGVAFWPDGLSGLLAVGVAGDARITAIVEEIYSNDIIKVWNHTRSSSPAGPPRTSARTASRRLRWLQADAKEYALRQFYQEHLLQPCRVPAMAAGWVISIGDMMKWLDITAPATKGEIINSQMAAFIAARSDEATSQMIDNYLAILDPHTRQISEAALLSQLQARHSAQPLPALAKWLADRVRPEVDKWHNRRKREDLSKDLEGLVKAGNLGRILDLVFDPSGRQQDEAGAQQAVAELAVIDAQIKAIDGDDSIRALYTRNFGHTVVAAIGLALLILTVLSAVAP